MTRKMIPTRTFDEIESLVNAAISTNTKNDGEEYIGQLKFMRNTMTYEIAANIRTMFSELVNCTIAATGSVRDKTHWVDVTRQALLKLKLFGVEDAEHK
ncbi:MAG: hypothetical protein VB099_11160 [Candidatus Limiplasma sp.]|nr:hypothetical protein [Candidatus Limiplasma sp.]